jgi:hypothetical protein
MPRVGALVAVAALTLALASIRAVEGAGPVAEACPPEETVRYGFPDVAADHTHRDAIACMAWWRITRGRADGSYGPAAAVSRAQVAGFLARLVGTPGGRLPASPPDSFGDDAGLVHHYAINRLAAVGVIAGRDGLFAPSEALTRGQMASLLVRALEYRTGRGLHADRDYFSDDDGSVHEQAINKAAAAGIARGVAPERFSPQIPVTRGQMASFLARTLQVVADADQLTDTPRTLRLAADLRSDVDCDALLGHLKEHALERVDAYGGFFATPPADDEADPPADLPPPRANVYPDTIFLGVDEPDLVKIDGERLFTVAGWNATDPSSRQLRAIDVSDSVPRLVGALSLGEDSWFVRENSSFSQLLLHGERVLLFGGERDQGRFRTVLLLVDVTDPAHMTVLQRLDLDGWVQSARLVDGIARVVMSAHPTNLPFVEPEGRERTQLEEATRRNREVVEQSTIKQWLPRYRLSDEDGDHDGAYVPCGLVRRPPEFSGLATLSVLTFDLGSDLTPRASAAVLASTSVTYSSLTGLYVATHRRLPAGDDSELSTEIHLFDTTDPRDALYVASGKAPDLVVHGSNMSEHDGILRVATWSHWQYWISDPAQSQIVTFARDGDRLVEVGQVGGIGLVDVRFLGDIGVALLSSGAVPVLVLDLADPANPRVTAELPLYGFPYLHPVGDGIVLAVGERRIDEGYTRDTQLSLVDVTDSADPTILHQITREYAGSGVGFDHGAFLYWPPTGLAVMPLHRWAEGGMFSAAFGFNVDTATGITEVGAITHPPFHKDGLTGYPGIRRSLVVGDRLYTISEAGVKASDLSTFDDRAWIGFDD